MVAVDEDTTVDEIPAVSGHLETKVVHQKIGIHPLRDKPHRGHHLRSRPYSEYNIRMSVPGKVWFPDVVNYKTHAPGWFCGVDVRADHWKAPLCKQGGSRPVPADPYLDRSPVMTGNVLRERLFNMFMPVHPDTV